MKTTTRTQLRGYGLTPHQATTITKNLTPISQQNRTNHYDLSNVISATRQYLTRPRIAPQTRKTLQNLLTTLLDRLGNVVTAPFQPINSTDPQLGQSAKKLLQTLTETKTYINDLKAEAATLKGKNNARFGKTVHAQPRIRPMARTSQTNRR